MKRWTLGLSLVVGLFYTTLTPVLASPIDRSAASESPFSYRAFLEPILYPEFPGDVHPDAKVLGDSLISYALDLLGSPYVYGDTGKKGFDCSGFTTHVFAHFGVKISRASSGQATDGISVAPNEAQKGDLIIFNGTNPADRSPGHVGIVMTNPGEPLVFVHSSSVGGVKVSEVETTGYKRRFLDIRRVL